MSKSKRTTVNNTGRKKKNPGKKSSAGKQASARSSKVSSAQKDEIEARERFFEHEAAFILVCFICLFLFLSNFGILGKVGAFTEGLQKGLFGYFAYVFPICIVLIVLFCIKETKNTVFWIKIASDVILGISICTMLHLAFGSDISHTFTEYYNAGKNGDLYHMASGGAIGGFIGDSLISSIARTGAWLLMITLFLLSAVIISEKSLINAARNSAAKAGEKAIAGSAYARNRFSEEKVRIEARREASVLRRKELEMEKALRKQEAQVLSPGSPVFDMKSERTQTFSNFGNSLNTNHNDEICLHTSPEGTFNNASADPLFQPDEIKDSQNAMNAGYDSDTIPFEETETEKYLAYGKMLNSGKIDLKSAQQMGFAVSNDRKNEGREATTIIEEIDTPLQLKAFEPDESEESEYLDKSYLSEEPDHLHRPLDPEEMVYPEKRSQETFETSESVGSMLTEEAAILSEEVIHFESKDPFAALDNTNTENNHPVKSEIVPDYDDMFHITDEQRASVYDEREKAAKEETASKPFSTTEEIATNQSKTSMENKTEINSMENKPVKPALVRKYQFPPTSILKRGNKGTGIDQSESRENAKKLEKVLSEFGVGVTVTNVVKGPRVTRYEMTPDVGVKVSRITSLSGDIKLAMAASELRIEAPIPGKSAVGIEIPNNESATVTFRDIMETDNFKNSKSKLTWGVGLDIQGDPVVGDIAKMPHLLVSGTTGSGKSVGINSIIMSVIYRSKPEEVRMILVDPKVVELSVYDGIPHLLAPVVTKPDQALAVLNKACAEMAHRYNLFKESNTRNIIGYNDKVEEISRSLPDDVQKPEKLPYILIIIDELSELMMHSKKDVESAIVSLTQLARAAGIHLVVATQRPSVDVVTGLIKSNIPSRVAYKLPSGIDSRTVLDTYGAENLLGNGDMLYKPGNLNSPLRVQGAYLSDGEVEEVVEWLKKHNSANYADEWQNLKSKTETGSQSGNPQEPEEESDGKDEYFYEAGLLITEKKKASIGLLQRKFKVGFNRASRIMEQLNEAGVVSDGEGTKERQILMSKEEFEERF